MNLTGNRRLLALTEALAALVWISVLAVKAPATSTGVLIITGGAVATMLAAYLGMDGYIKGKRSDTTPDQEVKLS